LSGRELGAEDGRQNSLDHRLDRWCRPLCCRQLAAVGANILIHGRDQARAKSLADDIRRQGYAEPTFYPADLLSLSGARQLAEAVLADHKRLDLFISNVGIGSRTLGAEHRTSADGHDIAVRCELPLGLPAGVSVAAGNQGERALAYCERRLAENHVNTTESRFATRLNRLLQQNRHVCDMPTAPRDVRFQG
jgi:hypothetical protein